MKDGSHMLMFANVLQQITGNIQKGPLQQKDNEFLQLIPQEKMADPVPHALESATIDLLVGSDYFWHIIGGDRIMSPSGIFMLPSRFGYIITGRCPEVKSDEPDSRSCTLLVTTSLNQMAPDEAFYCSVNVSLVKTPNLERFWCLETIGITDPVGRESDDEVLEMFCKTIKFKDGRYQVT